MHLQRKFSAVLLFVAAIAMLAGIFTSQAKAQTVSLTGTITEPDGTTPISSVYIYVYNSNWTYYQSAYTNSNGVFSYYDIPAGTYTVQIYKPWNVSYYPPEPFSVTITADQTNDLGVIKFKNPNVTGTIKKADGTAASGMSVSAANSNWSKYYSSTTNSSGVFGFYIETLGDYTLYLYDDVSQGFYTPGNIAFTVGDSGYNFGTITGKTQNVIGYFKDKDGNVISGWPYAQINNSNWTVSKGQSVNTTTGAFGFYVPVGTYTLTLYGYNSQPDPAPQTVTVTDDTVVQDLGTIRQPAPNITVNVKSTDGTTAISNAYLYLHNSNWTVYKYGYTNTNGVWETTLSSAGSYCIDTYLSTTTAGVAAPDQYCFSFAVGDALTINLQAQVSSMKVKVIDQNGNASQWTSVSIYDSSRSYSGSDWISTNSEGVAYSKSLPTGTYTAQVYPPYSSTGTQLIAPAAVTVSLTKGQMNTTYYDSPFQLAEPKKTINGTVQDQAGNKITDAYVYGWQSSYNGYFSTETNSSGNFTAKIGTGKWQISVYPKWTGGSANWTNSGKNTFVEFTQDNTVTESASTTIEVLSFTSKVTGKALYPNGVAPSSWEYASVSIYNNSGFWNYDQIDPITGDFEVKVPGGTFTIQLYSSNQDYTSPDTNTISVGENTTYDTGTIYFVQKKENIICKITDSNGSVVSSQYCYAWKDKGYGWASGTTDKQGSTTMKVSQGTWTVSAYPSWTSDVQYVNTTGSQQVTLKAEETKTVNFTFGIANSTIKGKLKDAAGNNISEQYGWIEVKKSSANSNNYYGGMGCSISGGSFECKVPAGTWELTTWMWGSNYSVQDKVTVTIADNETKDDVVITLLANDATISGHFVDADGNNITDLSASVMADNSNGSYQYAWSTDGSYSFKVAAGTWKLGTWINWGSAYVVKPNQEMTVQISSAETKTVNIILVKENSTISGTVTDSSGTVLQNVYVSVDTQLGSTKSSTFDMYGNQNDWSSNTDQNGKYAITVPEGSFYVTASTASDKGYMKPKAVLVEVSETQPAEVNFTFQQPNAAINGTVKLDGALSPAYIYAWSEQDRFNETITEDGNYSLPILTPDTWHIGAVYEVSETSYYVAPEQDITAVEGTVAYIADLILAGQTSTAGGKITSSTPQVMPEPVTSTFSSTNTTTVGLTDNTKVIVPARAILETEQNVTITATPTAAVPRQADAKPLSYLYDMKAVYASGNNSGQEISSFASTVTFEIPYTETQLTNASVTESELTPMYWDAEAGKYRPVQNVIQDIDKNIIKFTASHFSYFGLMTSGVASSQSVEATVPTLTLTSPENNTQVTSSQVVVSGSVTSTTAATVAITLNGAAVEAPTLDSNNAFSKTVINLKLGSNTISIVASNTIGQSQTAERTVVYSNDGQNTGDDTPDTTATAIEKDIIAMRKQGTSEVKIYSRAGKLEKSFYAFNKKIKGTFQVEAADLNADNDQEIVVSAGKGLDPQVRIFNRSGKLLASARIYSKKSTGGVKFYLSDINADNLPEIVTAPEKNGIADVRIYTYNAATKKITLLAKFNAFSKSFTSGVRIAFADVTGAGKNNIIVTPQANGTPQVKVYAYDVSVKSKIKSIGTISAYSKANKMGIKIMAIDLDGDGVRDIVTAPFEGHAQNSNVKAYAYSASTKKFKQLGSVIAFGKNVKGAINIRTADMNNDGKGEIIVAPHENSAPTVKVYGYNTAKKNLKLISSFSAYKKSYKGGVDFVISNLDGDQYPEVVTSPRNNAIVSVIKAYEFNSLTGKFAQSASSNAYTKKFKGHVSVNTVDLDGNGDHELVVSPLENSAPTVKVLDFQTSKINAITSFSTFQKTYKKGVLTATINSQ